MTKIKFNLQIVNNKYYIYFSKFILINIIFMIYLSIRTLIQWNHNIRSA